MKNLTILIVLIQLFILSGNGTLAETHTRLAKPLSNIDLDVDGNSFKEVSDINNVCFQPKVSPSTNNLNISQKSKSINTNSVAGTEETKTTSLLWGKNGELWDSRGRLPFFAYAGYDAGKSSVPVYTDTVNVLDYGAMVNDTISDYEAIVAAIAAAPSRAVVYFPAGKYIIDDHIVIKKSELVLAGEGNDSTGTVFYLPYSATEVSTEWQYGYATGGAGFLSALLVDIQAR